MLNCVASSSRLARHLTQNCTKARVKSKSPSSPCRPSFGPPSILGSIPPSLSCGIQRGSVLFGRAHSITTYTSWKSGRLAVGRRFAASSASASTEQARRDSLVSARRLVEVWDEWEKETDPFKKRTWGKSLIDLYAALSKQLSIVAKDEAEFEHLATVYGHPVVQNHYRLGVAHAQRFEWEQAVENLQRCVELDPTNYTHYMKFGEVLHASRMYGSAVNAYSTVLTTMQDEFKKTSEQPRVVERPPSFDSTVFKDMDLTPRKQYPFSKLAETLYRRAHSHLQLHDWESALIDWKSVIGLEPNHRTAESWGYLAHISRINGKWQQTIDLATKALSFDSELLIALYERSMANFVLRNEQSVKSDNRKYAILVHEKLWGLSNHPVQPDWGPDSYEQPE